MKTIPYEDKFSPNTIDLMKEILSNDGVVIYPTDTLYGIGGNFCSPAVIEKIDGIKKRASSPYSVIVPNLIMLEGLVNYIPDIFFKFYRLLLPGKFTFLFYASSNINPVLLKGSNKIGIRIPHIPGILDMVSKLGFPLITTSVNFSGENPLNDPAQILKEFSNLHSQYSIDIFIDKGALAESSGSTILDITEEPIRCIRKGEDFSLIEELGITII